MISNVLQWALFQTFTANSRLLAGLSEFTYSRLMKTHKEGNSSNEFMLILLTAGKTCLIVLFLLSSFIDDAR